MKKNIFAPRVHDENEIYLNSPIRFLFTFFYIEDYPKGF